MTVLYLCLAFLVPAGSIALDMLREGRSVEPAAVAVRPYSALFRQPGAKLPHRPEGMASLKAEIAKAPTSTVHVERSVLIGLPADGFVATPEWRMPKHRKTPDWIKTDEHKFAWSDFFADEPDDLAIQRKWDGAGLVKAGAA